VAKLDEGLPVELRTVSTRPLFVMRLDVKGPLVVGGTSNGYRRIGIVPGGRSKESGCRAKSLKAAAIGRRSGATAQRRWTSDWS
jgi:hypothetical protein